MKKLFFYSTIFIFCISSISAKEFNIIDFLETKCSNGNAGACCSLGSNYTEGNKVPKNHILAKQYYKKACHLGNVEIGCWRYKNFENLKHVQENR